MSKIHASHVLEDGVGRALDRCERFICFTYWRGDKKKINKRAFRAKKVNNFKKRVFTPHFMLWNGSAKRGVPGCDEKLLIMYFRTKGIPTGTLKALLKRVCCWKHTLLSYLVPISFKIFIHVLAFLCVKANSKEICQEISFSSFFFPKNAYVSIFVEIQI